MTSNDNIRLKFCHRYCNLEYINYHCCTNAAGMQYRVIFRKTSRSSFLSITSSDYSPGIDINPGICN